MMNEEVTGHVDVAFDNSFTYSLQELADGDYDLYVDIVDVQITTEEVLSDEQIDEMYSKDDKEVTADDFCSHRNLFH